VEPQETPLAENNYEKPELLRDERWAFGDRFSWLWLALSLGLAALLLIPFLGTIPGLHGDEAWAGVRAHEIVDGMRPMVGMTSYTGAMYQYLLVPGMAAFGFNVTILRAFTVATSLICVVLYYVMARRLFDRAIAGVATLVLVSMPSFTAYGRVAYEVFALNPILAIGAIVLLLEGNPCSRWVRMILLSLSGICLGLGTWNHIIFVSVPISLLAVAVYRCGRSVFRNTGLYVVVYGFCLVMFPRLYFQIASANQNEAVHLHWNLPMFFHELLQRFWEWPGLFMRIINGDPIYRRFAGEVRFHSPNLIWPVLLSGIILYLKKQGRRWSATGRQIIFFAASLFLTTLIICPANSDRYFLLVLYVVPLLLACAFREIFQLRALRRVWPVVLCAFISIQLTRTLCNYFASQIKSHGKTSEYRFGSQLETSSNFIRTDELYEQLVSLGAKRVYAEFFIAMPLRFYDLEGKQFASLGIVESPKEIPASRDGPDEAYAVVYKGGLRRMRAGQYKGFEEIFRDEHFVILKPPISKMP